MKSYSQAGQDRFVADILGLRFNPRVGTFLDIGANNPIEKNNTYALETEFGWKGLCVDNSGESMEACERERKACFYLTDATLHQNWLAALAQAELPTDLIDYLSLDVDAATLATLKGLPLPQLKFKVITIEHDAYRFGPGPRDEMIEILAKNDYDVLCADVMDKGLSFEIWAAHKEFVSEKLRDFFRRDKPTEWTEFFK